MNYITLYILYTLLFIALSMSSLKMWKQFRENVEKYIWYTTSAIKIPVVNWMITTDWNLEYLIITADARLISEYIEISFRISRIMKINVCFETHSKHKEIYDETHNKHKEIYDLLDRF